MTVSVKTAGWEATRSAGYMLAPVTLLVVPDGSDDIVKKITVTDGKNFNVGLTSGTYDLVAACGLDASLIPDQLSAYVNIPSAVDFAVGKASVTVENGVCTPETVSITAERQMAWLDVTLTGVPSNISKLNLYVTGLYEDYSLDCGWQTEVGAQNRFTQIPVAKNALAYEGSQITIPCSNIAGVAYVAEVTTTVGMTKQLIYYSSVAMAAGIHLTQELEYGEMRLVEGSITLDDWIEETDEGTFGRYDFTVGEQYLSQAATVVNVTSDRKSLNILAHRPMTVTINEMRSWDTKNVPYELSPEIDVQRWAFPTSQTSMRNIVYAIGQVGWDAFDTQFRSNGLAPIDRTATNILSYWDKTADRFYTYDYVNAMFIPVEDESGEFLLYPLGIVQLVE